MDSLQEFRERVARNTALAEAHPALHRLRVAGLALLGYGYLFGILFVLLGLTAVIALAALRLHVIAALKFGLPLLVLDWVVLRSLWVRLEPPGGRVLRRDEAPALFAEIERVRRTLGVEGLHRTIVMNDLNAAVVQHPRLGVFGLHQNYLLLGLPLMQALSREQFVAVLAHEFGHLSGNHGRFGTWIYRVRRTWGHLLASLEGKGSGAKLFRVFFEWFAPRFSAATFVLARQQEYEADRRAAELTDAGTAAATLVRLRLVDRQLDDDFWPGVDRRIPAEPEPPADLLGEQARVLALGPGPERGRRWAEAALLAPTDVDDTHPSLADRLRSLGVAADDAIAAAIPPPGPSAATALLGPALATLRAEFGREWQANARDAWGKRHEELATATARLAELRSREAAGGTLDDGERWEVANLALTLEGPESATPLVEAFAAAHPGHAMATWTRGRLALDRGEESGLASLEAAIAIDDDATLAGCAIAYRWLQERGRVAEADAWQQRAESFQKVLALAEQERAAVRLNDVFEPCALGEAYLESLRAHLRTLPLVTAAWLVRRRVLHRPHVPSYVFVARPIDDVRWRREDKRRTGLLEVLVRDAPLPPETFVVVLDKSGADFEKRVREQAGAPFYEAG